MSDDSHAMWLGSDDSDAMWLGSDDSDAMLAAGWPVDRAAIGNAAHPFV